jgi:hypothetical protein
VIDTAGLIAVIAYRMECSPIIVAKILDLAEAEEQK